LSASAELVLMMVALKKRMMALPEGGKTSDNMCMRLDTVPQCDGQTKMAIILFLSATAITKF